MTVAEIKGYWNAVLGPFLGDASGAVVSLSDVTTGLTIELQPYWEWEFGIKQHAFAKDSDEKCCPPISVTRYS